MLPNTASLKKTLLKECAIICKSSEDILRELDLKRNSTSAKEEDISVSLKCMEGAVSKTCEQCDEFEELAKASNLLLNGVSETQECFNPLDPSKSYISKNKIPVEKGPLQGKQSTPSFLILMTVVNQQKRLKKSSIN